MVTREEVEQRLEAQKTAILLSLTVSLRNAPGAVKPFKAVVEESEQVHHRGVALPAQGHGKHRVGRIKSVSVGVNVGVTSHEGHPALPTETERDELAGMIAEYEDTETMSLLKPVVQH